MISPYLSTFLLPPLSEDTGSGSAISIGISITLSILRSTMIMGTNTWTGVWYPDFLMYQRDYDGIRMIPNT